MNNKNNLFVINIIIIITALIIIQRFECVYVYNR